QSDRLREPRQTEDADHRQGYDPGGSHPRDPRPNPPPEQATDHIQRDRRLASSIGADDGIDGSRSGPARTPEKRMIPRGGVRPSVIAGRPGMRVGHWSRPARDGAV